MDTTNNRSLETFVERHRADFDIHEPRPNLWAALEQQLASPVAGAVPPAMRLLGETAPAAPLLVVSAAPAGRLQHYGIAAALALLVFAAGASEAWKVRQQPIDSVAAAATNPEPLAGGRLAEDSDAALYQSTNPTALTAAEHTTGADSQLVRAVRGMETYYTSQLTRRQSELRQLSGPGRAAMTVDWQRELVSLDSSYRQLKLELLHHPQPDAVLTAMNRNLQIRLDILDRQLHVGTAPVAANNAGAYVLADSRRQPE